MTEWKLVPVEPDEQQIYAMRSAFYRVRRGGIGGQTLYACYQRENAPELAAYSAMLEAAPQPPKLSDERILELMGFRDQDFPMKGDKQYRLCIGSLWQRRAIEIARAIEREILGA